MDSTSTMLVCHALKQANTVLKTQMSSSLQNLKTILGAKNKSLVTSVDPIWAAMKSDTSKLVKVLQDSEGAVNREQLDGVKGQFEMILNNIFKVKKAQGRKKKSKSQKYLDKLRRAQSGNTENGLEQLEQLNEQDDLPYEQLSDGEMIQETEESTELRRLVSGFSNLGNLERNKNPTIDAMSSDLMDLGNGSYMEVQLTRLDFLEKNTEWVRNHLPAPPNF